MDPSLVLNRPVPLVRMGNRGRATRRWSLILSSPLILGIRDWGRLNDCRLSLGTLLEWSRSLDILLLPKLLDLLLPLPKLRLRMASFGWYSTLNLSDRCLGLHQFGFRFPPIGFCNIWLMAKP